MSEQSSENRIIESVQSICRLHREGKSVETAVETLNDSSDTFVRLVYVYLSQQANPEETEQQILELVRAIFRLHQEGRSWSGTSEMLLRQGYQDRFLMILGSIIYSQFPKDVKTPAEEHQQSAKKALYYDVTYERENARFDSMICWTDRYLVSYDKFLLDSGLHIVELFDAWNDKSMELTVEKRGSCLNSIQPLYECFGISVERENLAIMDASHFVSLVELNLCGKKIRKLHTIQIACFVASIIVDKSDPTEFCLQALTLGANRYQVQICKVIKNEIVVKRIIELELGGYSCYSNGCLYRLSWNHQNGYMLSIYNVEQNASNELSFHAPEGYTQVEGGVFEVVNGRIYLPLEHVHIHGIMASIDIQTLQWTISDLATQIPIKEMILFYDTDLVIHASESQRIEEGMITKRHQFYKIAVHKPDLLRNMAWMVLVKYMKRIDHPKVAYEAARKYLPYNADIRCPFVKPEPDEKTGSSEKRIKSD